MVLAVSTQGWVVLITFGLVLLLFFSLMARYLALWVQAYHAGAPVGILQLVGMSLRKVDPRVIVLSKIRAVQAGLRVDVDDMERHYLSGGHVSDVVNALIAAENGEVEMDWAAAAALDLSGQDVIGVVEAAVKAKLAGGPEPVSVAQDLSQLVGAEAVAETEITLPGIVRVGDVQVAALPEDQEIPAGAPVQIVRAAETHVVVREIPS